MWVSFSAPRVQHLFRCSPSVDNPALDLFDGHLRSVLSRITNTNLSDTKWLRASLSIKHGGLEIRQVRSLALPAFLASAASSSDIQSQILLASACTADTQFDTYLADRQGAHGPLSPSDPWLDWVGSLISFVLHFCVFQARALRFLSVLFRCILPFLFLPFRSQFCHFPLLFPTLTILFRYFAFSLHFRVFPVYHICLMYFSLSRFPSLPLPATFLSSSLHNSSVFPF